MLNGILFACALAVQTPNQTTPPTAPVSASTWTVQDLPGPTTLPAQLPNLVRGANGAVYMTWVEFREDDTSPLLISSLEDDEWTTPRVIAQPRTLFVNWADFPGVSALRDGTLLAYWLQRDGSKHGYTTEVSLSSDQGETWSPARRLHEDPTSGEHGFVSVVPLNDSEFLTIWLDGRETGGHGHGGGSMQLLSRTVHKDGSFGEEQLIDDRVCDCCQTSLTLGTDGEALVAYRDRDAEEVRDVSAAWFKDGSWSDPKTVRDDQWLIEGCPVNGPQLASRDGRHGVAWFTGAAGNGGRVYASIASESDGAWGFPLVIDNGAPIGRVDLEFIDSERALVTWLEFSEGSMAEWRARPILGGTETGEDFTLGSIPNNRASGFLRMTSVPDGAIAAWTLQGDNPTIKVVRISAGPKDTPR